MLVWGYILGDLMVIICELEVVRESLPFGLLCLEFGCDLELALGGAWL